MKYIYLILIICLFILYIYKYNNQSEYFQNKNVWITKHPDYLTKLYKPVYTYIFYNTYYRDIILHRNFSIGYYSLDGTIENISSSLVIQKTNTIIEPDSRITNIFGSIDNRNPLPSQKSDTQFSIFTGDDISIDNKWKWFYEEPNKRKDFGNWFYYCNSFCDYMSRDMFHFKPNLYPNFEIMFKDFLNGKIDFFISPINDFLKKEYSFSFLYSKVSLLGYLEPLIFKTNNVKKINIYKKYSFYNEYFSKYFDKYKKNKNIYLTYENELYCFANYPNYIHKFGVMKLNNIKKSNSIPFYLFSHSPNSKYTKEITKNLMEQIYKIIEHQKVYYLNLINNNLHENYIYL